MIAVNQPRAVIEVGGRNLLAAGYGANLHGVEVVIEENMVPSATVTLADARGGLFADGLLGEDQIVRLGLGHGQQIRGLGTFLLAEPTFARGAGDKVHLNLTGEARKADRVPRCRRFDGARLSEVARAIAAEEGWAPTIRETKSLLATVTQADETNWAMLLRMARSVGYVVEVVAGELYFGRRRSFVLPEPFRLGNIGDRPVLHWLKVTGAAGAGADTVVASGFDPMTKESWRESSVAAQPDDAMRAVEGSYGEGEEPAELNAWGTTDRAALPSRYLDRSLMFGSTAAEAREAVEGRWLMRRWVVSAEAEVTGDPRLAPGAIITLENVGSPSGRWYVRRARHRFLGDADGHYRCRLDLLSVARGARTDGAPIAGGRPALRDTLDLRPASAGGQVRGG